MIVKVCGLTRPGDAELAIDAGATHLGVVFAPRSPRAIPTSTGREIVGRVGGRVPVVGVFQAQPMSMVLEQAAKVGLDWIQLHGGFEPGDSTSAKEAGFPVIWAAPVEPDGSWLSPGVDVDLLLLDTKKRASAFGGTGTAFAWGDAHRPDVPFLVAGGLNPDNIYRAVAALDPAGVDLSSGVEERPGIKSPARLAALGRALAALPDPPPEAIGA